MSINTNFQAITSFIDNNVEIARIIAEKKKSAADKAKTLADAAFKEVQENEPKLNTAKSIYKSAEEDVDKAKASGFAYGNSLEDGLWGEARRNLFKAEKTYSLEDRLCEARRDLFKAEKTYSELTAEANELKVKADKAERASKLASQQFEKIKFKAPIRKNSLDMHVLSITAIQELTNQIKTLNQQVHKLLEQIPKNVQPKSSV